MQVLPFAALAIVTLSLGALCMQDTKPKRFSHPVSKDADGGMARWLESTQPSEAHARLKELLGSFETTTRMFMAPGQPPMESKGTAEIGWFTEGKWIQQTWSGSMLGQPLAGTSLLGFDNFKQRYVWCSADSLQTTLNTASGHFDASGDHLILWGTIDEPMTPEQDKQVKYVYRNFGQDKFMFEVHDMMIGETNTKVFEVEYLRKR